MAALAGMLGGASMILPGLSGGFVLLLLGQYVVILSIHRRVQRRHQTGQP